MSRQLFHNKTIDWQTIAHRASISIYYHIHSLWNMSGECLYSQNPRLSGAYKPCFSGLMNGGKQMSWSSLPRSAITLLHRTGTPSLLPVCETDVRVSFSLLLLGKRIMFPIVRRWKAQRHPASETKVSSISHLGLQDSWMTRYAQTKINSVWHTRQLDVPDTPVKMMRSMKNSVVHFARTPLSTVILA